MAKIVFFGVSAQKEGGVKESCFVTSNLDVYQIVVESGTHSSGMRTSLTVVMHYGSQTKVL